MNNKTILDWSDNMHLKQAKDNVIQMPKNPTHMDFDEWRDWRLEKLRNIAQTEYKTATKIFTCDNAVDDHRTRFGQHVLESLTTFIDSDDACSGEQECGDAGYYVMLYFVEKLFPGICISMNEAGGAEINHCDTHRNAIPVEAAKLLTILINELKALSMVKPITPYDVFVQLFHPL